MQKLHHGAILPSYLKLSTFYAHIMHLLHVSCVFANSSSRHVLFVCKKTCHVSSVKACTLAQIIIKHIIFIPNVRQR